MFFLIGDGIQDSVMPPRTQKINVMSLKEAIFCLDMDDVADAVFGRTALRRRSIGLNQIGFVKRRSWVPSIPPPMRLTRQIFGQHVPELNYQPCWDHYQGHPPCHP